MENIINTITKCGKIQPCDYCLHKTIVPNEVTFTDELTHKNAICKKMKNIYSKYTGNEYIERYFQPSDDLVTFEYGYCKYLEKEDHSVYILSKPTPVQSLHFITNTVLELSLPKLPKDCKWKDDIYSLIIKEVSWVVNSSVLETLYGKSNIRECKTFGLWPSLTNIYEFLSEDEKYELSSRGMKVIIPLMFPWMYSKKMAFMVWKIDSFVVIKFKSIISLIDGKWCPKTSDVIQSQLYYEFLIPSSSKHIEYEDILKKKGEKLEIIEKASSSKNTYYPLRSCIKKKATYQLLNSTWIHISPQPVITTGIILTFIPTFELSNDFIIYPFDIIDVYFDNIYKMSVSGRLSRDYLWRVCNREPPSNSHSFIIPFSSEIFGHLDFFPVGPSFGFQNIRLCLIPNEMWSDTTWKIEIETIFINPILENNTEGFFTRWIHH